MTENSVEAHGSIEFVDAVNRLSRDGGPVYVELNAHAPEPGPTYRVIHGLMTSDRITLRELLDEVPPVKSVDMAQALHRALVDEGVDPAVRVFFR